MSQNKRQQFDSIEDGHAAALIAMGVLTSVERETKRGPECPLILIGVFEKYRELKFIRRETSDKVVSYPRKMLEWADVDAYQRVTRQQLSLSDIDIIMRLDAIFEGRDDD